MIISSMSNTANVRARGRRHVCCDTYHNGYCRAHVASQGWERSCEAKNWKTQEDAASRCLFRENVPRPTYICAVQRVHTVSGPMSKPSWSLSSSVMDTQDTFPASFPSYFPLTIAGLGLLSYFAISTIYSCKHPTQC